MEQRPLKKVVVIGPESTGKSTLCELLAQHYNTLWCPEFAREYLLAHGMDYSYDDLLTVARGQVDLEDKYVQWAVGSRQPAVGSRESGVNSITPDSELRTPNSELRTPNSELRTPNSELRTPNSELRTPDSELRTPDSELRTPNSELTTHHSLLFLDTDMYVMKVWCEFVFGKCHDWILEQIKKRKYDLYLVCDTSLPWVKDELREYPDLATRDKLYSIYKDTMINQSTPWVEISGNYEERLQKAINAVNKIL